MTEDARPYKAINFRTPQHLEIEKLRDYVVEKRNNPNLSLADVVSEAIKFYREYLEKNE